MLAVIGGSGLSQLANLDVSHREVIRTPYGDPSCPILFGKICGQPVAFLARHGVGHTIPPHKVNYCANIWALQQSGVTQIISVASVGSIRGDLAPGDIVIPHQIIDYTAGRKSTFFDGRDCSVVHTDFTEPYDGGLRAQLLKAIEVIGIKASAGAVYAATQGPRLETAAEINRLERDGCDVVGMTGMPEAVLARELNLPYAAINVVANYAAGRGESQDKIDFSRIEAVLQEAMHHVRLVIEAMLRKDH